MAQVKPGQPFGLDPEIIKKIDWDLALQRVRHDLRSDFFYAPHLSFIYAKAGDEIIRQVKKDLEDGKFNPGVPMTIEVPKTYRMPVGVGAKRLGPNYSRPGSILMPKDRLLYQALADEAAPIIESETDHERSFSHKPAKPASGNMFVATRTSWNALQKANAKFAQEKSVKYVVRIDIANFFGSLNQHTLVNVLADAGYPSALSSRLENLLAGYAGERSSRGILQGMYPSDLLGNFYLAPIDQFLKEKKIISTRYVDDMYIFIDSVDSADSLMQELIPELRSYDLGLNEAKCKILPASALITEEPDLEALFEAAVAEVSEQLSDEDFDVDYGFQAEWEDSDDEDSEVDEEIDLELAATRILFESIPQYPGYEENIERFCLPLFAMSDSDHAVSHVIDAFRKRASMSQIYSAYLAEFIDNEEVAEFMVKSLEDASLMDWQKVWIIAALMQRGDGLSDAVKASLDLLRDATRHEALRAVAAVYVGRYGDHSRRKTLRTLYNSVSPYIQCAIYYSSRNWQGAERSTAKASWGTHNPLNQLLTIAMENKPKKV
ncbi:RNA-directed DNA polymerase [Massilia sp. CT11-108]|uniref:RNA-directed DNA polymerase n=1 Tax=Massilia sp. CT11-108 TaxID=3393900 RepID=UPI0039A6DDDA